MGIFYGLGKDGKPFPIHGRRFQKSRVRCRIGLCEAAFTGVKINGSEHTMDACVAPVEKKTAGRGYKGNMELLSSLNQGMGPGQRMPGQVDGQIHAAVFPHGKKIRVPGQDNEPL